MKVGISFLLLSLALVIGCETAHSMASIRPTDAEKTVVRAEWKELLPHKKQHRVLTENQERVLREFSLAEAPQLWQTVHALRGEIDNRDKAIQQLAVDLREFDRKPEEDADYRSLQIGREHIACTLDNVYQKLEDAYIAYKKFQATPGKREYADAMNRALEDGIHEAEETVKRFGVMSINK